MKTSTKIFGLASLVALTMAAACGSDNTDTTPPGTAGTGGSGTSGSSGSSGTAGATAGNGGSSGTAGSSAGTSGAGASGTAGTAGTSGNAGTSGGGTGGGTSGTGGQAGEAGMTSVMPDIIYDFETDAQKWADSDTGVTVAQSTDQAVTGTHSLKVHVPALANTVSGTCPTGMLCGTIVGVAVPDVAMLYPGTVITYHVFTPAGTDGLYVQAISQYNNYKGFDSAGNGTKTITRGAWSTWTYTVPQTYPGGLEKIGIQVGLGDTGAPFAGGDFYIDSISVTGGSMTCTGAGTGNVDYEVAGDLAATHVDQVNGAAPTDTAISQSTDQAVTGTNSLKVAFTALPMAASATAPTQRLVYIDSPNAFCGQTITFNVWTPTGSDMLTFQAYAQTGWYAQFPTSAVPTTITRNGWTQFTFTLPATINAFGLQRIGLQFAWADTANPFTGNVYVDAVKWP